MRNPPCFKITTVILFSLGQINDRPEAAQAKCGTQCAIVEIGVASMSIDAPILVTGAAGRVGGVGRDVVEILRSRNLPVRALVHREDERADVLRAMGAEVVLGDLTRAGDVARALAGCRRMYFGMSVSAPYLEATVTAAAVARQRVDLEVFVNLTDDRVANEPDRDDRFSPAPAALACRAGTELVGIACGACPTHGLPPELLLFGLGRRINLQERHNSTAIRHRADVANRRSRCGGGRRGRAGKSLGPHWQSL